jgi:hypothetical protein
LLQLLQIQTTERWLAADLRMAGSWRNLSAAQAAILLQQLPTLANHACRSGKTEVFGQRIAGALLPHAVEHITIDLLARRFPKAGAIAGNSVRINNSDMRVKISHGKNALIPPAAAKSALMEAVNIINNLPAEVLIKCCYARL